MKAGNRVAWSTRDGEHGEGLVISDEEAGHVLVAIDVIHGRAQELRPVIRCAVTWLTVIAWVGLEAPAPADLVAPEPEPEPAESAPAALASAEPEPAPLPPVGDPEIVS